VDEGDYNAASQRIGIVQTQSYTDNSTQAQEGPDSNTPSHAATPTGSVPASLSRAESTSGATGKTGNKKKRATDKDDDDEKAPKRGKITYSRD
jgi:chromatin modification-related protein EAF6